eukprot:IDg822t1
MQKAIITGSTSERDRGSARSRRRAPTVCRGERIDLVRSVRTGLRAQKSGILRGLKKEVANAVAGVHATRGREASLAGRIRSAKVVPETFYSKPMFRWQVSHFIRWSGWRA